MTTRLADQTSSRCRPTIRGCVRVTLTRAHVDRDGYPNRAALHLAWSATATLPAGAEVVLDLGPARHVDRPLLQQLLDALDGGQLTVQGGDADVVREHMTALGELA